MDGVARAAGPWLDPGRSVAWWWGSAWLWTVGFVLFFAVFSPILVAPRADGKPG